MVMLNQLPMRRVLHVRRLYRCASPCANVCHLCATGSASALLSPTDKAQGPPPGKCATGFASAEGQTPGTAVSQLATSGLEESFPIQERHWQSQWHTSNATACRIFGGSQCHPAD